MKKHPIGQTASVFHEHRHRKAVKIGSGIPDFHPSAAKLGAGKVRRCTARSQLPWPRPFRYPRVPEFSTAQEKEGILNLVLFTTADYSVELSHRKSAAITERRANEYEGAWNTNSIYA